jgi:hypothetical protein
LKTRDFASDAEVFSLVEAFEAATIPASEFTHVAHIAVALSYLNESPADEALARMRKNIRAFAAHHGVNGLYHETLTTFWMKLLDHVGANANVDSSRRSKGATADLPLWQRINSTVAKWGTSAPVKAHYSREVIQSKTAREKWVPPDRLPLPF